MREEYYYDEEQENEALLELSEDELKKFERVARAFIMYPNNVEVSLAFNSNLATMIDNLRKIHTGYFDPLPEMLGKILKVLEEAESITKEEETKALIQKCIEQIHNFYNRFGFDYKAYYPKYEYEYYSYPYNKQQKQQLVDKLSQQVLQEEVKKLKEREDADLKQRLKDNLLFDLIAQSHPFGGKQYTYAEQVKKQLDWEDIDKRLMDIALSIKEEQKQLEEAEKELASLQNKEVELSASEEQLKKVREKLLEKAIDYVIASGRQE
jgi:hypothetical protein